MTVVGRLAFGRESQDQVAERLVFLLLDRIAHEPAAEEDMGLLEPAFKNQTLDLREDRPRRP